MILTLIPEDLVDALHSGCPGSLEQFERIYKRITGENICHCFKHLKFTPDEMSRIHTKFNF